MNTDFVSIFESLESCVLYLVSIFKSWILCLASFLVVSVKKPRRGNIFIEKMKCEIEYGFG